MRKAEIVIIGGGVVGASVAYHLAERGVSDVLILECESKQGLGSTGKATGGIRAQFETDINIQLSLYSRSFFESCDFECGYEPAGYLFFATCDRQFECLSRNVANQLRLGVSDVSVIDRAEVCKLVPGIQSADIVGGTFGSRDGFIDPIAVMNGFTSRAAARGVRIEFDSPVISICENAGRVTSVTTPDESIECDAAVICSGPRASDVAGTIGIDLPVRPVKRQIVWAETIDDLPNGLPMVIDAGTGFHFRPARNFSSDAALRPVRRGRQVLLACPGLEEVSSLNTVCGDEFIRSTCERAYTRASFLRDLAVVEERCRAGFYENTPDHHAIIGGCEVEGLFLANGFSGHGVMHSPATGRALAEIIVDGGSRFLDVSCLHIDRFARGELLQETTLI
ncbi:MAG: FAD-dependent oxidoreductase [Acidobacteriota bacterium]